MTTLTTIEKAAKLMGYELSEWHPPAMEHLGATINGGVDGKMFFNPYTNKADLMDVECALSDKYTINTTAYDNGFYIEVYDTFSGESSGFKTVFYRDHPDKFTARAHAVMAVVEQIYDRREG